MAKIMDPVLPIYSLFGDIGPLFWALFEVQVVTGSPEPPSKTLLNNNRLVKTPLD